MITLKLNQYEDWIEPTKLNQFDNATKSDCSHIQSWQHWFLASYSSSFGHHSQAAVYRASASPNSSQPSVGASSSTSSRRSQRTSSSTRRSAPPPPGQAKGPPKSSGSSSSKRIEGQVHGYLPLLHRVRPAGPPDRACSHVLMEQHWSPWLSRIRRVLCRDASAPIQHGRLVAWSGLPRTYRKIRHQLPLEPKVPKFKMNVLFYPTLQREILWDILTIPAVVWSVGGDERRNSVFNSWACPVALDLSSTFNWILYGEFTFHLSAPLGQRQSKREDIVWVQRVKRTGSVDSAWDVSMRAM